MVNRNITSTLLLLVCCHWSLHSMELTSDAVAFPDLMECYRIVCSAATFHYFLYWQRESMQVKDFDEVIQPGDSISIETAGDGSILSVTDDQESAVLLGLIPYKQEHIDAIAQYFSIARKIGVYTFVKNFERRLVGLDGRLFNNKNMIEAHRYDTIDRDAPNMVDLFRVVRDLRSRAERGEQGAYVHCKAGMGRSAAGVGAYILYLAKVNNKLEDITVPLVEKYLLSKRNYINFHPVGRERLGEFHRILMQNDFDAILHDYGLEINKRETELQQIANAPLMSSRTIVGATLAVALVALAVVQLRTAT